MNKTPQEILQGIREAQKRLEALGPVVSSRIPLEIKIIKSEFVPPATMLVSPDVYELFELVPRKPL